MADKDKIGDPFTQAAQTGVIGARKPISSVQQQIPDSPTRQEALQELAREEGKTEGLKYYRKYSKHPDWKKQTLLLPPQLISWLKFQALQEGREMSEITVDALETYKQLHPMKGIPS